MRVINTALRTQETMVRDQIAAERQAWYARHAEAEAKRLAAIDHKHTIRAFKRVIAEIMFVIDPCQGDMPRRVDPRPHPSDEGEKPHATNWPHPGKRIMPGSHRRTIKFSHGPVTVVTR